MMSKASRKGEGGDDDEPPSSSSQGKQQKQQRQGEEKYDDADYEPEPEEKISIVKTVAGICLLGLVLAALGATVTELWPSHMAPQSIMSHAHDAFQADPDVSLFCYLKVKIINSCRHPEDTNPRPLPRLLLLSLLSLSRVCLLLYLLYCT